MTFFTDKWTIAELASNNMVLVRKSKTNILLEKVVSEVSFDSREVVTKDILEEYDMEIDELNNIYILYQNTEGHLILNILRSKKKEEVKLTAEPISEVFDLNIIVEGKEIHILYMIEVQTKENQYRINHHYYDGTKWSTYGVDEITREKVLNPIRIIKLEGDILISYYSNDREINLRRFRNKNLEWEDKFNIVNTENHKVFLDMIKHKDIIHLTYCEFIDGNLVIRYNKILYDKYNKQYIKHKSEYISNEGSPAYPNIIFYEDKLWITWVELNKVVSRYSDNQGDSWDSIYEWSESGEIDFVRYKYINANPSDNIILKYSFGSIYPEVRFIGFGPLENAVEVPIKKKGHNIFPRI
ncbi:hypothetical protein KQI41_12785 [Tissierella pigra]|uniref:Uncharacterized protein n=1 Tax=Tissierella pigra TaxID=2607614 RepID=A0A6N7Y2L1_9FIRM|nr:hypothetical protein [Tissierella pigra]MBU5427288.1 hypothetical protein [Tissierella pigra]MSU03084.1 hypothetical protein [Tissierella pigra]